MHCCKYDHTTKECEDFNLTYDCLPLNPDLHQPTMSKSENSIFNELEEDIKAACFVKPYPHLICINSQIIFYSAVTSGVQ